MGKQGGRCGGEAGDPEGLISSPDQGAASQSLLSLCFPELPSEFF